jgi:hypothetical protein
VELLLLHRLAARDREAGTRQDLDALEIARVGQLGHRAGEQVVAARLRRPRAVLVPRRRAPATKLGAVDQIVVDQRGHVGELDRDSRAQRELAIARGEVDEERSQALAARPDRVPPDRRDEPRMALHRRLEALLELVQVGRGLVEDGLSTHGALAIEPCGSEPLGGVRATCSATVPPPSSR